MKPYEILHKKVIKVGGGFQVAPEDLPPDTRTWTGFCAYVPGDMTEIRKKVEGVRLNYKANVMAADGQGAWVSAGYNDLCKIIEALRKR